MRDAYFRAMDRLHQVCVFVAGAALVVITLIIPYGVFTRFVLNSASSWPEPMAILLMIVLSFLSAVICYREHLHIAVGVLPNFLQGSARSALGVGITIAMLATNLFLLWYGIKLCQKTWYQSIAEFPIVSVGVSYLPVPIGGLISVLYGIERMLKGDWFPPPPEPDDIVAQTIATE
jgi:TRAP-type C4-dicarboxylate transport system permease small subunit